MKIIIGKIYADWCGHCQSLAPEWDIMKSKMIKSKSNIKIIEIEVSNANKLERFKQKYPNLEINGYPTIFKIYPNGQIDYYNGNRIAFDMKKWVLENKYKNKKTNNRRSSSFRNNKTKKVDKFYGIF